MRSRSFILGLTVLALFASACTKGDWQKDAISFAPVASKPTKAIISGTTYPTGESFIVSAFHNGTAAYFEDLTASRISDNLWETSSTQYWPWAVPLPIMPIAPLRQVLPSVPPASP